MNPFLHPAVATPLEPDDIPLWRPVTIDPAPDVGGGEEEAPPVPSHSAGNDGKEPGTLRVRIRRRASRGRASMSPVFSRYDRKRGIAHGTGGLPACLSASKPKPAWQGRVRSLVLATALGLGMGGSTAAQPAQVNANVATAAELETIKGIGPKTARSIVSERQRSGLFESFQDFSERIRGIGTKRAASLRAAGLVIGPPIAAPAHITAPAGPGHGAGGAPVGVLVR